MGINIFVGWIAILAGLLAGARIGMFFHRASRDRSGGNGTISRLQD